MRFIQFTSLIFFSIWYLSVSAFYSNQRQDGNQPRRILFDPAGLGRYHSIQGLDYWAIDVGNVDTANQGLWLPSGHIGTLFNTACFAVANARFDKFATNQPRSLITIIPHLTIPQGSDFNRDKITLMTCTIVEQLPSGKSRAVADYTWHTIDMMNNANIFKVQSIEKVHK